MQTGEGERLHNERRRRFWKILGLLALVGAVGGFVSGFIAGAADATGTALPGWVLNLGAAAVIVAAIGAAYGSYRFFVSVDEVEVADNLWGSLIGFYAYTLLFPTWWLLHKLGHVPEPDDWVIFGIAIFTALAAYAVRKWQQR